MKFFGPGAEPMLSREVKSVGGGYNSFNKLVSHAAQNQVAGKGEVMVQVKSGTNVVEWMTKFRTTPKRDMTKYKGVTITIVDETGTVLHSEGL